MSDGGGGVNGDGYSSRGDDGGGYGVDEGAIDVMVVLMVVVGW